MKTYGVLLGGVLFMCGLSGVFAQYVQTYWDHKVLQSAEQRIYEHVDDGNKEAIFSLLATLKNRAGYYNDDPQASYMLYELTSMLEEAMQTIIDSEFGAMGDEVISLTLQERIERAEQQALLDESEQQTSASESEQSDAQSDFKVDNNGFLDPFTSVSRKTFYESYMPFLQVDRPLPERCFTYYDQIDQVAKSRDFPTALIIATWHREHTCNFSNPGNGRGNFQITSHNYPPGAITWDQFRFQIMNFIDFKEAKWRWYDAIQVYGPESVTLSHSMLDLSSLRKSAIVYNGVYPDVRLDYSWYANENFTQEKGGRNGIVASVLQVLRWEFENGKIN